MGVFVGVGGGRYSNAALSVLKRSSRLRALAQKRISIYNAIIEDNKSGDVFIKKSVRSLS